MNGNNKEIMDSNYLLYLYFTAFQLFEYYPINVIPLF